MKLNFRLTLASALCLTLCAGLAFASPKIGLTLLLNTFDNAVNPPTSQSQETYSATITQNSALEQASTWPVPATAGGTAIPVGSLVTLGYCWMQNTDATNNIDIMNAVSGTALIRLQPGEAAIFRFTPGVTAPAAISSASTPVLKYRILNN